MGLYLDEANGVDDAARFHQPVCALAAVDEIVAFDNLLKLTVLESGHKEVAQPIPKDPLVSLEKGLPEGFVRSRTLCLLGLIEVIPLE